MKLLRTLAVAAALSFALAPLASAHTHVRSTSIADNAVVSPPDAFTVVFSEPAAIASVGVTNAQGGQVPLAFTPPAAMAASYTIPLPALAPGAYVISWRTIAHDGHVMNGAVHFTVRAPS